MTLFEKMKLVKTTNPYFQKDLKKAEKANKFIGVGSILSSTNKYREACGELANCGHYESSDVVFISAEGARKNRENIPLDEIMKAISVGASFITDSEYDRNRPYNVGEREIAKILKKEGYSEVLGRWTKKV